MKFLLDPDRLGDVKAEIGGLINRQGITETAFGYYSSDELTGPRCERCSGLLHVHLWQLTDGDTVIDCEATS